MKHNCSCKDKSRCNCEPKHQVFLTEVREISSIGGTPAPKYDTPFYDTTKANHFITIPEEDAFFFVEVPLPARWSVGQWVTIENVGHYPISSLQGSSLVLKNVAGVANNPTPGSQFLGSRKLWVTTERLALTEDLVDSVTAAMASEDFGFCANIAAAGASISGNPVGSKMLTDACDACNQDSPTQTAVRCFFTWTNIIFKWLSIALPLIPKTTRNAITFRRNGLEVTEPMRSVLWHPETGELQAGEIPSYPAVQVYYEGTFHWLPLPADYATVQYALSPNQDTGYPAWVRVYPTIPADYGDVGGQYFLGVNTTTGEVEWTIIPSA